MKVVLDWLPFSNEFSHKRSRLAIDPSGMWTYVGPSHVARKANTDLSPFYMDSPNKELGSNYGEMC